METDPKKRLRSLLKQLDLSAAEWRKVRRAITRMSPTRAKLVVQMIERNLTVLAKTLAASNALAESVLGVARKKAAR